MKRNLSIIASLLLVLLLSSCTTEKVKYNVQVNDAAHILSVKEIEQLQSTDIKEGYQVVIITTDSILEQNLYKHTRKHYRQIKKQTNNTNTIAIFCFKNEGLITTNLPASIQNIIDSKYMNQYFKSQKVEKDSNYGEQAFKVLKIINIAIAEHEELSAIKKSSISNGICDLFESLFIYTIPQDSWIYKVFFHIPMHIALFLAHAMGTTSMWIIIIFIAALLVYKGFIRKLVKANGQKPIYGLYSIGYFAFKLLLILTICCLYTTSLPRYELIWSMQEYGISATLVQSLLSNFHNATMPHFGWLACTLFCIFMTINSIISEPDKFLLSFFKPEIQQRIYKQEKTDIFIARISNAIEQGYDDFPAINEDNNARPYLELLGHRMGKSSSSLLLLVPMCLILNANLLILVVLYNSISFSENVLVLIDEFVDCRKRGLLY